MPITLIRSFLPAFPLAPAWVSGRFYGPFLDIQALTTLTITTSAYALPFLVPNLVTVTSIGCECSGAGGAGSLFRFAIYKDNGVGMPSERVLDAGTVASDSIAYQSITISQALNPGWYWCAIASLAVTTNPVVRAVGGTPMHTLQAGMIGADSSLGYSSIEMGSWNSVINNGFPKVFASTGVASGATMYLRGTASPRVMLGV